MATRKNEALRAKARGSHSPVGEILRSRKPCKRFSAKEDKRPASGTPSYKFLVSACLAGENCAYDGKNRLRRGIKRLVDEGIAIVACPEVMGGSTTPREPCEIIGGSGADVLDQKARVLTVSGKDVSAKLIAGAKRALALARRCGITKAILKSNSPSCGKGRIYDGTFTGSLKKGDGVTAALLCRSGITVCTQERRI